MPPGGRGAFHDSYCITKLYPFRLNPMLVMHYLRLMQRPEWTLLRKLLLVQDNLYPHFEQQ